MTLRGLMNSDAPKWTKDAAYVAMTEDPIEVASWLATLAKSLREELVGSL